jgi:nucleotide-binding universal stress UspA family protein
MTVLVPIDATDPSRAAVELASRMAQALGQDMLLLHIAESPPPLSILKELDTIAEPYRARGLQVRLRSSQGEVVDRICRLSVQLPASWVVMGTRGIPLTAGDLGDSVAWRVLQRVETPVVAVRPAADGAALLGRLTLRTPEPHARAQELARLLRIPDLPAPMAGQAETTILSFDPDCLTQGPCEGLVSQSPGPILLVGGGNCTCAQTPLPKRIMS